MIHVSTHACTTKSIVGKMTVTGTSIDYSL